MRDAMECMFCRGEMQRVEDTAGGWECPPCWLVWFERGHEDEAEAFIAGAVLWGRRLTIDGVISLAAE